MTMMTDCNTHELNHPMSHLWRTVMVLLLATLMGPVMAGCSSASGDACDQTQDCFSDETCVDGTCQIVDDSNDEPNDDPNDEPNDDPNVTPNQSPNNSEPDTDCIENLGICGDQYCHPNLRECVDCVRNDHCDGEMHCDEDDHRCRCPTGTHDCHGECVADDDPAHCGDRCEPCPQETGATATCEDGACGFECEPGFDPCSGPGCETHCIECQTHSDCTDPDRSRCYEGRCQGCAISEDCAHKEETPVCDRDTGSCIQCSVEESAACQGNSCDPATNECTDTPLRSRDFCESCVADQECRDTQRCVPMNFAGQSRPDGYCLYKESLRDCERPHAIHIDRESLSGYPQTRYCGIREEKTTCEAYLDYFFPCGSDSECGASNLDDGECTWFSGDVGAYKCTYSCSDHDDCDVDSNCRAGRCIDPWED